MSFPFVLVTSGHCQDLRSGRTSNDRSGTDHPVVDCCSIQHWYCHRSKRAVGDRLRHSRGSRSLLNGVSWETSVEIAGHRLPRTFSVRTPSGGLHLYFSAPDQPLGNTAGKLGGTLIPEALAGMSLVPARYCRTGYYRIVIASPVAASARLDCRGTYMAQSYRAHQHRVQQHQDH